MPRIFVDIMVEILEIYVFGAMRRFLFALLVLILFPLLLSAQVDREIEKSVKVYFRQGVGDLDESYMGNETTLRNFAEEVKMYYADSNAQFRQIRIVSSISPEGSMAVNDRIAKRRAEAIADWIRREINVEVEYAVESMGVDWARFAELVESSDKLPYRDELLALLKESEEAGESTEKRFAKMMQLRNGEPYRWADTHLFSELRYAAARCKFWGETIPTLDIANNPQRCGAMGGAVDVPYTTNMNDGVVPEVVSPVDWITPMPSSMNEIKLVVAPNSVSAPRSAKLAVEYHGETYELDVEQEPADPMLRITSADKVNYGAEGYSDKIAYEKNIDDGVLPTVSCSADWIESLTLTEEGITYTVAKNSAEEPRSTTIVVDSYGTHHEVVINQEAAQPECEPFYMGIKTNMLYDIAALPNIGAEFYLGGNFSIAANYAHAWWAKEEKHFYWRYCCADASIRWWFGKPARIKPLQGHHLGVNYQILTYDFQLGKTGIMAGMPKGNLVDRANHIVALEYGYSLPIARRLNLDFNVGFGYHWGLFEEYDAVDGHSVWQATKRRQYFGPTKLEISLVWLIGCGNYNKDK